MRHRLAYRQLGGCGFILPDDADPGTPTTVGAGRVDAEHRDGPFVTAAMPLQDLHRRALAGPVRPEDPEHLAPPDPQVQAVDGGRFAVALPRAAYFHREFGHGTEPLADP
ncbi:hypothetical protein GCM10009647_004930 [Streptomyces sanglieri]